MTLHEADARARTHAVTWVVLATLLAAWAFARGSWIALVYGALADLSALGALAAIYRLRRPLFHVVPLSLGAAVARAYLQAHPLALPWQVALGVTALAHALFAAVSVLAVRRFARI